MIRSYRSADYRQVRALSKLYPVPCSDEAFLEVLEQGHCWVAFNLSSPDKVIGFVIVGFLEPEPEIWLIVTDTEFRKQGIAGDLLDTVIEAYSNETISLTVDVDNPSQKLYFEKGFRVTGFHPNMYGIGKNGLTMERVSQ